MKEIKRYTFDELMTTNITKVVKSWITDTDHKAVVETLEKDLSIADSAVGDLIDLVDELKLKIKEYRKAERYISEN